MKIFVQYYTPNGTKEYIAEYDSENQAFTALTCSRRLAMAYPVDSVSGAYFWSPERDNTFVAFCAKMKNCKKYSEVVKH